MKSDEWIDRAPGVSVGNKAKAPNWSDGHVGPFGNWSAQPQHPWRFKIDFQMSSGLKEKHYAACPTLGILKADFVGNTLMKNGHGRFQAIEVSQAVNGIKKKWEFGNIDVEFAQYLKSPAELHLFALETTSLWVKKLAMILRDCAIDPDTGFYYPYACRHPIDVYLTTYGFKSGYSRLVVYHQCGILQDRKYEMDYSASEILENELVLLCRRAEFRNFEPNSYKDQWR